MEGLPSEKPVAPFRAGFVAIVGRPNTGKSTLLNAYLGQKVAIVSPRPQTTRTTLRGVLTLPQAQIVFLDTPGIHRPVHRLGEYMVAAATRTIEDGDVVVFLVDLTRPPGEEDHQIVGLLREKARGAVILALNKADAVADPEEAGRPYREMCVGGDGRPLYRAAITLSALQGPGRQELLETILSFLPESPPYYPEDFITDQPLRVIAAELVREQVLHFTRQEVPHAVAVIVEEFKERSEDLTYISATVYVEKDSQKKILLGKGGQMLKQIGQAARQEIEAFLGKRVYLDLWVKVRKNWRKDRRALRWLGYDLTRLG
ncbi:MAG: GTPase Era [Chloroflexia bacterium]